MANGFQKNHHYLTEVQQIQFHKVIENYLIIKFSIGYSNWQLLHTAMDDLLNGRWEGLNLLLSASKRGSLPLNNSEQFKAGTLPLNKSCLDKAWFWLFLCSPINLFVGLE